MQVKNFSLFLCIIAKIFSESRGFPASRRFAGQVAGGVLYFFAENKGSADYYSGN